MPFAAPVHRSHQSVQQAEQRVEIDKERLRENGKFYCGAVWRKFRLVCLATNPLCMQCMKHGVVTVATDCHHIKDRRTYPTLALDPTNIESLCHSCHSKLTAQESKR